MKKSIQVILVEDHHLVRAGIRSLLNTISGITVIAEASNGREALETLAKHKPDVALVDIAMPDMSGLEVTEKVTSQYPDVRVVILSMYSDEEYVRQALRAGASGYVLKDAHKEELELALKSVAEGGMYLSHAVSKHVVDYLRRAGEETQRLEQLTDRQKEILRMIAEGSTTKEIAHALSLSAKTVETHRAHLMERLDIHDLAGLVRYAVQAGIVGLK